MFDEITRPTVRFQTAARVVGYLVGSYLLLYPALSTAVVADDLINPFAQTADAGGGLGSALRYGWHGATDGASFRLVGNAVGSGYNWLWVWVSAHIGLNMSTLYGVSKYATFIVCAMSVAAFWWSVAREYGRAIEFWDALVLVSLALFGTVQVHALWSNDPVASYPLSGYGSTAIGFAVMTCAVLVNRQRTWRWASIGAGVSVIAVLYYEINIGAVLGAAVILLAGVLKHRADRRSALVDFARGALFVCVPAVVIAYGRTVTGGKASTYGGTDVRLSGSLRTFVKGVAGAVPGSAWRLSNRALGGHTRAVAIVLGVVIAVAVLVLRWWLQARTRPRPTPLPVQRLGLSAATIAAVCYATFAVALQAITVKVQDETREVGYVYTSYAMGSAAVALGLAVGGRAFLDRPVARVLKIAATVLVAMFLIVQSTVNWRLQETLDRNYAVNSRLLDSFDEDVPAVQRCNALASWSQVPWPDYYRNDMTEGLQVAYEYYFGEPFCATVSASG